MSANTMARPIYRRWYRYTITGHPREEWHLETRLAPRVRGRKRALRRDWLEDRCTVAVVKRFQVLEGPDMVPLPLWRWCAWIACGPHLGIFKHRRQAKRAVHAYFANQSARPCAEGRR